MNDQCNSFETFKISKKSICHSCFNINEKCSMVHKSCNTDSKIGKSFVAKCSKYNKDMSADSNNVKGDGRITVSHAADSRVEMMGGGYKDDNQSKS
jgi:hypothetical protein